MKNHEEFLENIQTANLFDHRLKYFIDVYHAQRQKKKKPFLILDIGCGRNVELFKHKIKDDIYYGCDYYAKPHAKLDHYVKIDLNREKLNKKLKGKKFDIIFCGEVIEHLYSPDDLIDEIKDLMHKDSLLILSTPNFSYWANRVLLLLGISPFFMENSSVMKLGRKTKWLGQYNKTEGHIRLFTYGALLDLFALKKLKIVKIKSVPLWNFWVDKLICKISRDLAPCNVYVLQKKK